MRFWSFAPVIALAALVAVSAFVLMRGGEHQTLTEGRIGRPAPSFSLARLDGQGVATPAAFAGRTHIINVFASWCVPCRAEHPVLMQLKAQGVPMIGVAFKDKPEDTRAYLSELGDPFETVALDSDGRYALDLGAAGVPESFVVGPDGRIRTVVRGPLTQEVLTRQIEPALAQP